MQDRREDWKPDGRSKQVTSPLVGCFWCERLHPGEHPLSVCPACAARLSTMRSLEMNGPYPLSDEAIDALVTRTSPGNYALGYMDERAFVVFYVGRSDCDLRERLHEWVGAPSRYDQYAPASRAAWASRPGGLMPLGSPALGRVGVGAESSYTRFAYSYASSAEAAFEKECRNYDDFGGGLDNEVPPARTPRSGDDYFPDRARAPRSRSLYGVQQGAGADSASVR